MDVGEINDQNEPELKVPWVPTTPAKPKFQKPVPIYTSEEGNQLPVHANGNGAVACSEFTPGAGENGINGNNGRTFAPEAAFGGVPPSYGGNLSFSELLLNMQHKGSMNSAATQQGNIDGVLNPRIPPFNSPFKSGPVNDQTNAGPSYPQGTSSMDCWSHGTSQDSLLTMQTNAEEKNAGGEDKIATSENLDSNGAPPNKELCDPVVEFSAVSTSLKENQNLDEGSSQVIDLNKTPQQKPRRRKHRPKVIVEGKPKRTRKPATQNNVQPKEKPTGKRKYVRKKGLNKTSTTTAEATTELIKDLAPESAKRSCRRNLNFDEGAGDESSAGRENATVNSDEDCVIIKVVNVRRAHYPTALMKHASNRNRSLPEQTKATSTSLSRRNPPGTKPPTKRKYVRKKALKKSSASPTEVTEKSTAEMTPESAKMCCRRSLNSDIGAGDENSASRENATAPPSTEIGGATQVTNVGLTCDVNTSMEHASNNHTPLPEDALAPSKSRSPEAQQNAKPTGKKKYVRKKRLNKSCPPSTEMTGELNEQLMPECNKMSRKRGAKDGKSAGPITKENAVVAEEMHVNPTHDQGTSMQQALPVDTEAPSTSPSKENSPGTNPKGKPTSRRTYVRKKRLKNSSAPPTEVVGELTEPMPESTKMSCGRSLNSDIAARDESSKPRENLDVHISKENGMLVEETHVGLAYDLSNSMKQALHKCMSLPEDTQAPSISPSKSNSPGAKLNVNSVQDKSRRNGQAVALDWHEYSANILLKSVAQTNPNGSVSQMVGNKRTNSASAYWPDTSSMNLFGAQYNGLSSYQTQCLVHFSNIQKKRRSGKGKAPNSYSMTSTQGQLTCPQQDAQAHPYASSSNFWIFDSERYSTRLPATESVISSMATFDDFKLALRRLTETPSSPPQMSDFASLARIRNCNTEASYTAKQQGISDRKTLEDAERPLTCTDALAETRAPLPRKKRNRKKNAISCSAKSSTTEMQHHHNFALVNCNLPFGKSSDIVHELIWKTMLEVDALVEQFRKLNINAEGQNAIVPYKKKKNQKQKSIVLEDGTIIPYQGDPIKKQHPRPKVDLDAETDRVWKLLMLDINSHGIDGTDEDKAKWWEEERNVFRGRADSFIARMHLVQGDRRFSRWKGSVVDSVVGVFLTQNVSDHLSSSAFMSLAARYPLKSSSTCKAYNGEGTSMVGKGPQVHLVEPEENAELDVKTSNKYVYDQSSMPIDTIEHSGEKGAINGNNSCRTTSSVTSLTDESNCRLSESSQRNIREDHCPIRSDLISAMSEEREEKPCFEGAGKELNDVISSQSSASQISGDFSNDQNPEKIGSCSDSNSEVEDLSSTAKYNNNYNRTSFSKLLEMASSSNLHEVNSQRSKSTEDLRDAYGQSTDVINGNPTDNLKKSNVTQVSLEASIIPSHEDENHISIPCFQKEATADQVVISHSQSMIAQLHPQEQSNHMQQDLFNTSGQTQNLMQKGQLDLSEHKEALRSETNEVSSTPVKSKSEGQGKEKEDEINWDSLRMEAQAKAGKREKTENTMDSLDWDAVRRADVNEIANVIKDRGMNNRLAERIKNFLNRLVEEHEAIDLEWLRDVPPDQVKEYLLSVRGLGLKSVECVRLLTLHHLAFPVDTNVGRIAVRLGWVPLQPLPESLQLHLLEMYPILESIQKYLWPRLCKLDQRTLYELHYQMITFGKVFCTKSKPNCNACPMRGECRHFASAFASARLALPGPEQRSIISTSGNNVADQSPSIINSQLHLLLPGNANQGAEIQQTEVSRELVSKSEINSEPFIEEPTTPEPECSQASQYDIEQYDIEDAFSEDSCEIPTIKLDMEEFTLNLQSYMQSSMELQEEEMSKALVALNPEAASIPMPKLKNVNRLRTEHCVYELPDTHPLLQGWDKREPDDPGKYLLAIWTPGETAHSIQPPESKCSSQECGQLCNEKECFACNSFREANSQIVRGTLLIPCRTAMHGSFPLNGTYFQVNEVFADHESSLDPISVPRSWIWNLNRRTVYFGTSVPTIFKGLTTPEIQQCFWRGYVCVRGFDRATRAPRPLMARLHFPVSKMPKTKESTRKRPPAAKSKGLEPNPEPEQPEQPKLLSNSPSQPSVKG